VTSPTTSKKKAPHIVLIDGANALYRAFFALPPMRNAAGEPTSAVLGFANMLQKVIREEEPDLIGVVFDGKGKTFRHELFPKYKAGREKQAEDLTAQFPVARDLARAYGLRVLLEDGVEADDIIATLVAHAPKHSTVTIVSTDKDLMQLVSDRVQLWDTMKDRRYGPAEVEARFGVPPEQLLDLRSLVGDASDNIPGVKGIGEKGAATLIRSFDTLENLLEHASDVEAKRARTALLEQGEQAKLSKRLATLQTNVKLPCAVDELRAEPPDFEVLGAKLNHLGFSRLLTKLDEDMAGGGGERTRSSRHHEGDANHREPCELICNAQDLERLRGRLEVAEFIAIVPIVPETGLLCEGLVGLAVSDEEAHTAYLPLGHKASRDKAAQLDAARVAEVFFSLLAGARAKPWISSDAKALCTAFAELGFELPSADFDLLIAGFLLDPAAQNTLAALAAEHLHRTVQTWENLAGRGAKATLAAELSPEQVAAWGGAQVATLVTLYPVLRMHLERDGLAALFDEVEMPLTAVLSRLERAGVRIDEALLGEISVEYEGLLASIEAEIFELAGERFKVNSPKQLQVILFEKLGLRPIKRTKTGNSTNESVLTDLSRQHPLPARVLAYRHLAKLKSTYVDALPPLVNPRTGRIHPTFLQTGAATGRLACVQPNLQNIPIRSEEGARIRTAFIPAAGTRLLCADYSQVELRILAHYSGDDNLMEAFRGDEDIHRRTAAEVLGIAPEEVTPEERAQAKAVNFGIIYGSSAFGLAAQLGIPTGAAQAYIDHYFEHYRGVRHFLDDTLKDAREKGFVRTLLGRRRYLPDLGSRNRTLRQAAERMAVNTVIQGTAADLIKKAMVVVDRKLAEGDFKARVILQVHDELVLEVSKREETPLRKLLVEQMESVMSLRVPLRVDLGIGKNWREAH